MAGVKFKRAGRGYPLLLGVNRVGGGYSFSVEAGQDSEVALLLYKKNGKTPAAEIPFAEEDRTGNVWTLKLEDFPADEYSYNYRIDGKVAQDPCACTIEGRGKFGAPLSGDEHQVRCGFLTREAYDWESDCGPEIPFSDMILYKLHVRGYTKLYKGEMEARKKGTFAGLADMIPYWQELGVNAIELMPAYEFAEVAPQPDNQGLISERREAGKVNYWGYQKGFYFAPKGAYCATKDPEREFRDLVKALHKAGIACVMEFYFPDGTNPVTALRALQFWKIYYHVDGFHLLGEGAPVDLAVRDSILSGTKLFVQGYDAWSLYGGTAPKTRNVAVYGNGFLQDMRRFLKSDEDVLSAASAHIRENSNYNGVVNYMTCQDGFTMQDLVSYNYKNNEANGEDNQDGSSYNYSWNCGVEGPTRKKAVCTVRRRQVRNAFLMMLLSQGVPMIYGGDEFGNSQNGNNNAYCQDNATGWIDWNAKKKNEDLFAFVKEAIAFRKAHPILHLETEMKESDYLAAGLPDISFHGERAWYLSLENTSRLLGVMYCGAYVKRPDGTPDDILYVGYNFHWENRSIALPNLPDGRKWTKLLDSGEEKAGGYFGGSAETYKKSIEIAPRTIVVLAGRQEE